MFLVSKPVAGTVDSCSFAYLSCISFSFQYLPPTSVALLLQSSGSLYCVSYQPGPHTLHLDPIVPVQAYFELHIMLVVMATPDAFSSLNGSTMVPSQCC